MQEKITINIINMNTNFLFQGILENTDINLDMMFVVSFINDLVQGMQFLHHSSALRVHGNLRSSNCLITNRWQLQVSDFGLLELRATADEEWSDEEDSYSLTKLLWKAPELLR